MTHFFLISKCIFFGVACTCLINCESKNKAEHNVDDNYEQFVVYGTSSDVEAPYLCMRTQPIHTADLLSKMIDGNVVDVYEKGLGNDEKWFKVRFNEVVGYAHSNWLKNTDDKKVNDAEKVTKKTKTKVPISECYKSLKLVDVDCYEGTECSFIFKNEYGKNLKFDWVLAEWLAEDGSFEKRFMTKYGDGSDFGKNYQRLKGRQFKVYYDCSASNPGVCKFNDESLMEECTKILNLVKENNRIANNTSKRKRQTNNYSKKENKSTYTPNCITSDASVLTYLRGKTFRYENTSITFSFNSARLASGMNFQFKDYYRINNEKGYIKLACVDPRFASTVAAFYVYCEGKLLDMKSANIYSLL